MYTPKHFLVDGLPTLHADMRRNTFAALVTVGFELPITRLEGKRKFNQNRSAADQSASSPASTPSTTPPSPP